MPCLKSVLITVMMLVILALPSHASIGQYWGQTNNGTEQLLSSTRHRINNTDTAFGPDPVLVAGNSGCMQWSGNISGGNGSEVCTLDYTMKGFARTYITKIIIVPTRVPATISGKGCNFQLATGDGVTSISNTQISIPTEQAGLIETGVPVVYRVDTEFTGVMGLQAIQGTNGHGQAGSGNCLGFSIEFQIWGVPLQ